MRLFIYGSCVSRDMVSIAKPEGVELAAYVARSSAASAFGAQPIKDLWSGRLNSSFQQRMVHTDLAKELPKALVTVNYDILLHDAIDERFNIFRFSDGRVCTLSRELLTAGFCVRSERGRLVHSGSETFFDLWQAGWSQFAELLKSTGTIGKLRINATRLASSAPAHSSFPAQHSPERIRAANKFLEALYARMLVDIAPSQLLLVEEKEIVAAADHRWGLSPFHYRNAFYEALAGTLLKSV
jgi:hypothetical protein